MTYEVLDDDTYLKFLEETEENASVYHLPEWIKLIEKSRDCKKYLLGIKDGQELVGVFPFLIRKKPFFKAGFSPTGSISSYGGPIFKSACYREMFAEGILGFQEFMKKEGFDYLYFVTTPLNSGLDIQSLTSNKYRIFERKTHIIPLKEDEEIMWHKLAGKCRNMVRKAQKNDVEVFETENIAYLKDYFNMAIEVYRKSNRPPPFSEEFLFELLELLSPQKYVNMVFATWRGKVIAGALFLKYKKCAYYLNGVSYTEFNHLAPNNLIQWEFIKKISKQRLLYYDMLGANIPSIAKFKSSFGGELKNYWICQRPLTHLGSIGKTVYDKLAHI